MIPELDISLPRPVKSIHQIEITSRCNLRCVYCVHPTMARGKADMSASTFDQALEWVRYCRDRYGQNELNLAGIGESTLHPDFVEYVRLARRALPNGKLILATNGVGYDESLVQAVAPYNLRAFVSLHRPEKAGRAIEWWRGAGLLDGVSADPSINANDWAGQVEWHNSPGNAIGCRWIRSGLAMVLSDGRVTTCCLDTDGSGKIGDVRSFDTYLETQPYRLCGGCYQRINVKGHDQRLGLPVVKG